MQNIASSSKQPVKELRKCFLINAYAKRRQHTNVCCRLFALCCSPGHCVFCIQQPHSLFYFYCDVRICLNRLIYTAVRIHKVPAAISYILMVDPDDMHIIQCIEPLSLQTVRFDHFLHVRYVLYNATKCICLWCPPLLHICLTRHTRNVGLCPHKRFLV